MMMIDSTTTTCDDEHATQLSYYNFSITNHKFSSSSLSQQNLSVRASKIPNAGSGLFTSKALTRDTTVATYTGVLYTLAELNYFVPDRRYVMRLGPNLYADANFTPWVLARYINDPRDSSLVNIRVIKDPDTAQATLKASRDIEANEELYIDYGTWYWLAYNMIYTPVRKKK